MKTIILLFTCLVLIQSGTPLLKSLQPNQSFCFLEDIPKHTLAKLYVSSNGNLFKVTLNYLRETLLNETSRNVVEKSFTTQNFGLYRICITAMDRNRFQVKFYFDYGIKAKDYGSPTENTDIIKSIQSQAGIAVSFIKQIEQGSVQGLQIMDQKSLQVDKYSMQYFFSVIFVGLTMGLTYAQFQIIKNHLLAKKYL